jgi:hypothetical protein
MSHLLRETENADARSAVLDPPSEAPGVTEKQPSPTLPDDYPLPDFPPAACEKDDADQEEGEDGHRSARLRREYEDVAISLARRDSLEERIAFYKQPGILPKLSRAAALRPDLMPRLNDEFEWITLTSGDLW